MLEGFAAGADDYLTKPFDLSILIARIQGLLRRREWLRRSPGVENGAAAKGHAGRGVGSPRGHGYAAIDNLIVRLRRYIEAYPTKP